MMQMVQWLVREDFPLLKKHTIFPGWHQFTAKRGPFLRPLHGLSQPQRNSSSSGILMTFFPPQRRAQISSSLIHPFFGKISLLAVCRHVCTPAWTSSKIFSKECLNTQPAKKRQFRTGARNMQPHGPSGRLNGDPPKYITQNLSSRMNAPFLNISSRSRILTINRENTLKSKHTTLTKSRALNSKAIILTSRWLTYHHVISHPHFNFPHLAGRVPMAFRSTRRASNRLNLQVLRFQKSGAVAVRSLVSVVWAVFAEKQKRWIQLIPKLSQ